MAGIDRMDERRQDDRRTARLGLAAAGPPSEPGTCLTAEQLADVATNSCTPEERKIALTHFAGCRSCYDAWVGISLSLAAMESGLMRRKRLALISLRNLSYLGSAIAVAASVVVFINVKHQLDPTLMAPPAAPVSREQAVGRPEVQPGQSDQVTRPAPPAESRQKKAMETFSRPSAPAAEGAAHHEMERSGSAPSGPVAADLAITKEAGIDPTTAWLTEVAAFCRQDRPVAVRWQELRKQGGSLPTDGRPIAGTVRAVLDRMPQTDDPVTIAAACQLIVELVAGADEKE